MIFLKVAASLILFALAIGISFFTQWLGWHGPKWMMIEVNYQRELNLSPLVFMPLVFLAIGACLAGIFVWIPPQP